MCLVPDGSVSYALSVFLDGTKVGHDQYSRPHPAADESVYSEFWLDDKDEKKFPQLKGRWIFDKPFNTCDIINKNGLITITHKEEPGKKLVFTQYESHRQYAF